MGRGQCRSILLCSIIMFYYILIISTLSVCCTNFGMSNQVWSNKCGLRIEVVLNTPDIAYIKCEDTLGMGTPTWTVDGQEDYEDIANEKTIDNLGLTVLSINWPLVEDDLAKIKCRVWRRDLLARQNRCGST